MLAPGEWTEFEVVLRSDFLLAEPPDRKLNLMYTADRSGLHVPPPTWMGWLSVQFGELWKEVRRLEDMEERWPGGNVKATGQTMNGQKYGEWHYFNEEGDRIKIVNYTEPVGTAECDPNSPENKGAGIRRFKPTERLPTR